MCRLYGFRANEETKVECSLVYAQNALLAQSRSDARRSSHPDGWGIAFYANAHPTLERRHTAAFDDLHFGLAAERAYSTTVLAHVRQATVGTPSPDNTHPFTQDRWAFAHNGTITGFDVVGETMAAELLPPYRELRRGTTDSELLFLWLLSRLDRAGALELSSAAAVDRAAREIGDAIAEVAARAEAAEATRSAKLNVLLTDGRVLFASRWRNSLWRLSRDGVHDCEICGIPHIHHHEGHRYRAEIVASEPITDEPWTEVADRSLLVVDPSMACRALEL